MANMIIRREKRQSSQQARTLTKAAVQRHQLPRSRQTSHETIMAWLLPRTGRS
jgi:hypothetical protein